MAPHQKKARRLNASLVFIDENGLLLAPLAACSGRAAQLGTLRPDPNPVSAWTRARAGRGPRGGRPQWPPFAVLWCDAPDEALVERLRSRSEDRHEVSDGREELLAEHRARYESPAHEPGVVRLDTIGEAEEAVEAALVEMESK